MNISKIEKIYGNINSINIIYRGETLLTNNVNYINVEEYLQFK